MIKNKASVRKKKSSNTKTIEWILTDCDGPGYVKDQEIPYRPKMVLCMDTKSGAIIGMNMADHSDEVVVLANSVFQEALQEHSARRPTQIRTSSESIAQYLQSNYPDITLVLAETPEIDLVLQMMNEHFSEKEDSPELYLGKGISEKSVAGFFKAAARLFKLAPWQIVPSDQDVMSLSISELGIKDHVISVIGQNKENMGFVIFSSISDFESFLTLTDDIGDDGFPGSMIPSIALNYDRGADLHADLKKEIIKNKWEVASAEAYPWIMPFDKNFMSRSLTDTDYLMFEAVSLSLVEFLKDAQRIEQALMNDELLQSTITVRTSQGDMEVEIGFPFAL